MTRTSSDKPPFVCAIAYDGLCAFEFSMCFEVFGAERPEFATPLYRFAVAAADDGPMRADGGLTFTAPHGLSVVSRADIVIIPGWRVGAAPASDRLVKAVKSAYARGARIVSICSGVFVLAPAGLLKGRRATTHWRYLDALAEIDPTIEIEDNVLYVDDGQILTSAGSAAGLDLCLHIVRADHGADVANAVARRLVLPAHRDGGQAQYVPRPMGAETGRIGPLLERVLETLDQDWTVEAMAGAAGLSPRTLLRRFKDATGASPKQWLMSQRLLYARELLETTGATVDIVARRSGFAAPETLRHHFRRRFGVAPTAYRAAFQTAERV